MNLRYPERFTEFGDVWVDMEYYNRFLQEQPNGCIHWTGGRHAQGYGMMGVYDPAQDKRKMATVHRTTMKMKLGRDLVPGENVIHQVGCAPACFKAR